MISGRQGSDIVARMLGLSCHTAQVYLRRGSQRASATDGQLTVLMITNYHNTWFLNLRCLSKYECALENVSHIKESFIKHVMAAWSLRIDHCFRGYILLFCADFNYLPARGWCDLVHLLKNLKCLKAHSLAKRQKCLRDLVVWVVKSFVGKARKHKN